MAKGCCVFDGTADYVRRTANLPTSTAVTIAGWVKITSYTGGAYGIQLSVYADGANRYSTYTNPYSSPNFKLQVTNGTGSSAEGTVATADTWHYYAVVCGATGAGEAKCYKWDDTGTIEDSLTVAGVTFTTASMTVGAEPEGSCHAMKVAQLRVWDRALSQAELEDELASSTIVDATNINTAWEDDPETDVSGNSRPWTVSGTSVSSADFAPNYTTSGVKRSLLLGIG